MQIKPTRTLALALAIALLLGPGSGRAAAHEVAFKSPGPGMHFTEGQPIIVFADLFDSNDGHGLIVDGVGWPKLQVLVDDVAQTDAVTNRDTVEGANKKDSNGNPDPIDFYRFSVTDVAAGKHQLVVRGLFAPPPASNGATQNSAPIEILVDAVPTDKQVISLSSDLSGPVSWDNVMIVGNGHKVSPSGNVVIKSSLITGLGSLDGAGISGSASSLQIEGSVFEAMGAVELTVSGEATIRNNEFRASNLIQFASSNPDASPVLTIKGKSSPLKFFQGNRVGAGRVVFDGSSNWLIGGDGDEQSNVLIGPRCTLYFVNGSSKITIRGNYDHHNYRGGWSQGFNLSFVCQYCGAAGGDGILAEHNFIRGGSWPVQSLVGEFRYNVIYGYGHDWLRSAVSGASIHHNLFVPDGGGGLDEGVWFYGGESDIAIYNNTFDGGGMTGDFAGPTIKVSGASRVASLRNNLITFSRNMNNDNPGSPQVIGDMGTLAYADYNAFYSPDNSKHDNYAVAGMSEGSTSGFAAHDVSGKGEVGALDGQLAAAPFSGARVYPLEDKVVVDEGAVWQGTQKISTILAAFREHYAPQPGSPIVNTGDPRDNDARGRRADIGAIDLDGHDQDQLGKFSTPAGAQRDAGTSADAGSHAAKSDASANASASAADAGQPRSKADAGRGTKATGVHADAGAPSPTTEDAGTAPADLSSGCGCSIERGPRLPAWILGALAIVLQRLRNRRVHRR